MPRRSRKSRRHRIRFWLTWWPLLTGLYVLLVFKTEPVELLAGAIFAAVATTGADLVRTHGSVRFAPGWGWLRGLVALPGEVLRDTGVLIGVLWRVLVRRKAVRGRFVALPFAGAHASGAEAAGRRAMVKWFGSVSPNTVVVGFAERHDRVLLHQLVRTEEPPSFDPYARP